MTYKFTKKQKKYFEPVLEWLDAGGKHVGDKGYIFDMRHWYFKPTDCGTAMCIGGALTQFNTVFDGSQDGSDIENLMGVPDEFFTDLFYPGDQKVDFYSDGDPEEAEKFPEYTEITPQWAAATIRDMLDTGEINWMRNKP